MWRSFNNQPTNRPRRWSKQLYNRFQMQYKPQHTLSNLLALLQKKEKTHSAILFWATFATDYMKKLNASSFPKIKKKCKKTCQNSIGSSATQETCNFASTLPHASANISQTATILPVTKPNSTKWKRKILHKIFFFLILYFFSLLVAAGQTFWLIISKVWITLNFWL